MRCLRNAVSIFMSIHAQSMHTFDLNIAISYHNNRFNKCNNKLLFIDKIIDDSFFQVLKILVNLFLIISLSQNVTIILSKCFNTRYSDSL